MSKVLYIDYENVQKVDLGRIAQMDFTVMLFAGASQNKIPIELVKSAQSLGSKLQWISIEGSGPNALDFHVAYYLGAHSAERPKDEYFILSKDKGFDPLIKHAAKNKIKCTRIAAISEVGPSPVRTVAKARRVTDGNAGYEKVVRNLMKIEEGKRPRNRKKLKGHIKTLLGKGQPAEKSEEVMSQLFAQKLVAETDRGLAYNL